MPDISMCANHYCTLKETCYRYKATPSEFWQSWNNRTQDKDGNCDSYWPLK